MTRAAGGLAAVLVLAGCGADSRQPPPIALHSRAGAQAAVRGSSCVRTSRSEVCGDTGYPAPTRISVVRPHETVQVRIRDSIGIDVDVHRFGCHTRTLRHIALGADGTWRVDLSPGVYELVVLSRFERAGASGDASGGLGVWVSANRRLRILPADTVRTLCP